MKKIRVYYFGSEQQKQNLVENFGEDYFAFIPKLNNSGWLYNAEDQKLYRALVHDASWSSATYKKGLNDSRYSPVSFDHTKYNSQKTKNNMQINDIVKCVKSTNSTFLRSWKTYMLVSKNQHGNWQVQEIDNGILGAVSAHWYKEDRFEVLALAQKPVPKKVAAKKVAVKKSPDKKAVIDINKKYRASSGQAVNIFAITNDPKYPVVGTIQNADGTWENETWSLYGSFMQDGPSDSYDLVEVPDRLEIKTDTCDIEIFDDLSILITQSGKVATLSKEEFETLAEGMKKMGL